MHVEKREEAAVNAAGAEHGFVRDERIVLVATLILAGICR